MWPCARTHTHTKSHPVPAVIGPDKGLYITDHHHLTHALLVSQYADSSVYVCPEQVGQGNAMVALVRE